MFTRRFLLVSLALALALPSVADAALTPAPLATTLTLPSPNEGLYQGFLPALACTSSGNCVAAGTYTDGNGNQQGALFSEVNGTWQTATELVPPANAVATSQGVSITNVACGAVGSCAVLGSYLDAKGDQLTFVDSQVNGVWGPSVELTMPAAAVATGLESQPKAIACAGAGQCAVVGTYNAATSGFQTQGYLANEVNGLWKPATTVVLPAGSNRNPQASLTQVACWSAGTCEAVGSYIDQNGVTHAITVTATHFGWHPAQVLALPSSASAYSGATLNELTCASTGACTAIGTFNNALGATVPMVATYAAKVWSRAQVITLPSNAAPNPATFFWNYSGIACPAVTTCTFGGDYTALIKQKTYVEGFVVSEVKGVWSVATQLPLPAGSIDAGANGGVIAVSCPSVGACAAAAVYANGANQYQTMVIRQSNTGWSAPVPLHLPGTATTVGTDGGIYGLVCFSASVCQVTGSYDWSGSTYQGFAARV